MKNTGIIYSGAEKKPKILPELANLLPPLTEDQLSALEANILKNGCYSPIIVNENLEIVDGHNRHALCEKHGIPYQMMVFQFEDTLEAMRWAVETQRGRRNLDTWELAKIALKLKPQVEARAKANLREYYGNQYQKNAQAESGPLTTLSKQQTAPTNTRKELAESVGIGEVTMGKAMKITEQAPQEVIDALNRREISVHQGYEITRQVRDLPDEEREKEVEKAVRRERMKNDLRKSDAEIDRRTKIAGQFFKAVEKSVILDPSDENLRLWVDSVRMKPEEIGEYVRQCRIISGLFTTMADSLERMYPDAADALRERVEACKHAENAADGSTGQEGA